MEVEAKFAVPDRETFKHLKKLDKTPLRFYAIAWVQDVKMCKNSVKSNDNVTEAR